MFNNILDKLPPPFTICELWILQRGLTISQWELDWGGAGTVRWGNHHNLRLDRHVTSRHLTVIMWGSSSVCRSQIHCAPGRTLIYEFSVVLFTYFISKDHKHTFRLNILHMCCEQCANTHHLIILHRGWCASSGGLKLVYKVYIKLKVDFPWYSAEVHGAEAFLEQLMTAAQLPPQSPELFCTVQTATVQERRPAADLNSWINFLTFQNKFVITPFHTFHLCQLLRTNFIDVAANSWKRDQILRFLLLQNLTICSFKKNLMKFTAEYMCSYPHEPGGTRIP